MRWQILIPLTSIVSSTLALSVIWWAFQRRKERESYYRYEIVRLLLERFPDGQERTFAWVREQEAGDVDRRRENMRVVAWVLLTGGLAALGGLGFRASEESLFGWVPIGVAVGLFVYLRATRKEAE